MLPYNICRCRRVQQWPAASVSHSSSVATGASNQSVSENIHDISDVCHRSSSTQIHSGFFLIFEICWHLHVWKLFCSLKRLLWHWLLSVWLLIMFNELFSEYLSWQLGGGHEKLLLTTFWREMSLQALCSWHWLLFVFIYISRWSSIHFPVGRRYRCSEYLRPIAGGSRVGRG